MKTGALKVVKPEPKTVQEWIRLRRIELRKAGRSKKRKLEPTPARLFLVKRSKPAQQLEFTFDRPGSGAMKGTTERCGLCGEAIKVEDLDAVQYHAGRGGLLHQSCLQEHDAALQIHGHSSGMSSPTSPPSTDFQTRDGFRLRRAAP